MGSYYGADISKLDYIRVTLACGIGSVLEWYDYTVLIALSPTIQQAFFPPGDMAAKQLSFWSVYAVGFIFRPLGSLLFGQICDVNGRRLSLMITLVMMAIPTVLIGCLPTYPQAGIAAPIMLSVLRLVQGIAVGGELGTAVVFMHELAPQQHKSKGGSIVFLGVTAGILMGLIVSMIVTAAIPPGALLHWGWRIPFLIAVLTAIVGMLLRYNMPESYDFERDPVKAQHIAQKQHPLPRRSSSSDYRKQQQQQSTEARPSHVSWDCWAGCLGHQPIKMLFRDNWREVLLLFWFETWSAANFYVFYGWLPSYIATHWHVSSQLTNGMTLANLSLALGLIPVAAHLSDKGLPRLAGTTVILCIAAAGSVPMLLAVSSGSMVAAWLMQMLDMSLSSTIFGWLPTIGSLLFPVHVRATGYNLAHTAAQSWLGGFAPLIISGVAYRLAGSPLPAASIYLVTGIYLTVCALVSLAALVFIWRMFPETNRSALDKKHMSTQPPTAEQQASSSNTGSVLVNSES